MSLIHDSLQKLETNQVKDLDMGFKKHANPFAGSNNFSVKKLWMIVVSIIGIGVIIYAYFMLTDYKQQNKNLLNEMQHYKSQNKQTQVADKVIIHPPAKIVSKPKFKKNIALDTTVLSTNKFVVHKPLPLMNLRNDKNANAAENAENNNRANIVSKPEQKTKSKTYNSGRKSNTRKSKNKLTVKQIRTLVNNLQMNIESKNQQEVEKLFERLAQSSGKNSIIYLRMKAYHSTVIGDDTQAVFMYKKILFQNPYDIQAGTNLAIIEAKNNQLSQAIKRLKELKQRYPTNKIINMYLKRLESN